MVRQALVHCQYDEAGCQSKKKDLYVGAVFKRSCTEDLLSRDVTPDGRHPFCRQIAEQRVIQLDDHQRNLRQARLRGSAALDTTVKGAIERMVQLSTRRCRQALVEFLTLFNMSQIPSDAPDIVFHAREVTKTYSMGEVKVHALRGVDLDLFTGELVVLLGPSGSGKSTLLNILGGLDRATSGQVSYRGKDLINASDKELTEYRRNYVGFVFQFYNLIPSLTARENVAVVTEIAQKPLNPEEALGLVGLSDRLDHFPSQLSGGQQQRIAIARAIAKTPAVLLCDEPMGPSILKRVSSS
jgi:putative ABC transport system ATP-binding protein